jgi:hypothetical protein
LKLPSDVSCNKHGGECFLLTIQFRKVLCNTTKLKIKEKLIQQQEKQRPTFEQQSIINK